MPTLFMDSDDLGIDYIPKLKQFIRNPTVAVLLQASALVVEQSEHAHQSHANQVKPKNALGSIREEGHCKKDMNH